MSRIAPVHYRKLRKVFERAGFKLFRTKGDHLIFTKPGVSRPVVIPKYKEVPVFVIKKNLKTAKINRKEYFGLLEK